jgi:transcriptional regulator with XRE-family HTH domain
MCLFYTLERKEVCPVTISERITYLRKKKGVSQAELARQCQMPQSTLHSYESGARSAESMQIHTTKRMAAVLGVSLDYLCGVYDELPERATTGDGLENGAPVAVNRCPRCAAAGVA